MTTNPPIVARAPGVDFENRTYAKVTWRLIPFLFICYVAAYLDRVNVGFAKLQMLSDLGMSEAVYGLGAGIFFVGYFLFEVPSSVMMYRVGAKTWIARIMITWGILSCATAFATTPLTFYIVRFLLGIAEAGFFPSIIMYLTYWYPGSRRSRMTALFMTAIPISGVVGGPFSGWIMQSSSGIGNMHAWQWLFILESIPSVLIGIAVLFYLDDSIRQAKWLSEPEKNLLEENIRLESREKKSYSLRAVFMDWKVWLMSLIYFCTAMGNYGVSFWLPSLIRAAGVDDMLGVGLFSAIPYGIGAVAMILFARSADKYRTRRLHLALAMVIGGVGLILSAIYGDDIVLAIAALTLASIGIMSLAPLFWSLPTAFLSGVGAAAGIGLINSIANLAGFASPYLIGWVKDQTHSTNIGLYALAGFLIAGAMIVLLAVPGKLVDK